MHTFTIFNNEPDIRTCKAGEVIFTEGEPNNNVMFAVLEGTVEVVRANHNFGEITAGSVFGEMALLDKKPRTATVTAKTDCRLAAISEYRFTRLVLQNPQFALEMMRLLVERLREDMSL